MYKLKSEPSTKSGHSMDGSYAFVMDDKSLKCSCSSPEAVPDTKWWLDHNGLDKCYSFNQLNVLLDAEVNSFCSGNIKGNAKATGGKHLIEEYYACHSQNDFSNANLIDLNLKLPKKLSSDLDSELIGLKNIEPWWHAADTRDLAFLVSHGPSQFVGNCELPVAQTVHSLKGLRDCINCNELIHEQIAHKETKLSNLVDCTEGNDPSIEDGKGSCVAYCSQRNLASVSVDKSLGKLGLIEGIMVQGSDETFSSNDDSTTNKLDPLVTNEESCGDISRSELLVALCHSQTRAREAENMAQRACDERDHIVSLFFRQASYLFAYRQWLRMLQLETLCLQLRTRNQLNSFSSATILRKNKRKVAKKKPGKPKRDVSQYVFAFALGLSLAGAGLLVGLTIGWIFPVF